MQILGLRIQKQILLDSGIPADMGDGLAGKEPIPMRRCANH